MYKELGLLPVLQVFNKLLVRLAYFWIFVIIKAKEKYQILYLNENSIIWI